MTKVPDSRVYYESVDWTVSQYHSMVAAGILAENAPNHHAPLSAARSYAYGLSPDVEWWMGDLAYLRIGRGNWFGE